MVGLEESGVTPLIQIHGGRRAQFQNATKPTNVLKMIRINFITREVRMLQTAEEHVKSGILLTPMSIATPMWGSIITAGIQVMMRLDHGAILLILIVVGTHALSLDVG